MNYFEGCRRGKRPSRVFKRNYSEVETAPGSLYESDLASSTDLLRRQQPPPPPPPPPLTGGEGPARLPPCFSSHLAGLQDARLQPPGLTENEPEKLETLQRFCTEQGKLKQKKRDFFHMSVW